MAIIGEQIATPEAGWKRYDVGEKTYFNIVGAWDIRSNSAYYNLTHFLLTTTDRAKNYLSFKFYGTKLRYIGVMYSVASSNAFVTIDGVDYNFSQQQPSTVYMPLNLEVLNLEKKMHTVVISTDDAVNPLYLDAIDIDSDGYLLHPDEVEYPEELEVGKKIRCHYRATTNFLGAFSNLGKETYRSGSANDFIPTTGTTTPDGDFYLICVGFDNRGRRKLVADRNLQYNIQWKTINDAGYSNGTEVYFKANDIFTSSNVSANGHVVTASEIMSSYYDYKAFDNSRDASACWAIPPRKPGWLSYKFPEERRISKYVIYPNSTFFPQAPNTWTFEGSNDNLIWDVLDSHNGITNWTTEGKAFIVDNENLYTYYRVNVEAFNGAADASSIGELELYEKIENLSIEARLPSGGATDIDKENEWDKIIVESSLNNTITPGDDYIWNWRNQYSFASTQVGASGNVTLRGYSAKDFWYANGIAPTFSGATTGYRPVFLIDMMDCDKYLLKDGNSLKSINSGRLNHRAFYNDNEITKEKAFLSYGMNKLPKFTKEILSQIENPEGEFKVMIYKSNNVVNSDII